jgi:plastocyanin
MTRTRIGLVVGLAVMALAVAGCGGSNDSTTAATDTTATDTTATTDTTDTSAATGTKLIGSVASDDFTITLTTEDGTNVTSLPAGDYTLEIVDKSDIHNFHMTGSGVDVMSEVGSQEDEDYPITLVAGSYHYQCDPHSSQMNGDFEVTG